MTRILFDGLRALIDLAVRGLDQRIPQAVQVLPAVEVEDRPDRCPFTEIDRPWNEEASAFEVLMRCTLPAGHTTPHALRTGWLS